MRLTELLAPCSLALALAGQSLRPVPNPVPEGAGVIAGRVVDATTHRPLAGVTVYLSPRGKYATWSPGLTADPSQRVTAGTDGTFAFGNLGPVEYVLVASGLGYADSGFGQKRPLGSRAPILLAQDERLEKIEILMWPPSELSGRVLNERGEPVVGVSVTATRQGFASSVTRSTDFRMYGGQATTDDLGRYRIRLQTAGRFIVCTQATYASFPIPLVAASQQLRAEIPAPRRLGIEIVPSMLIDPDGRNLVEFPRALTPPPPDPSGRMFAYASTCAPSLTSVEGASVVDVPPGTKQQMTDLVLQLRPAVRVSGRLVGPSGPVSRAWVRLMVPTEDQALGPFAAAVLTGADGAFTFMLAPQGTYALDVMVPNPPPAVTPSASGFPDVYRPDFGSGDPNAFWAADPLHLESSNIDGLVVTVKQGVTVSGTVTLDGDATLAATELARLSVRLEDGTPPFSGPSGNRSAAGTFAIAAVRPGRYSVTGLAPESWALEAITRAGRSLIDAPLDVDGSGVDDLDVRFTSKPTEISGVVRDAGLRVVRDAAVVVFPENRGLRTTFGGQPRRVRTERAVSGRYAFIGLPPGDYFVAALDDALMDPWPDPSFMATLVSGATRVSIQSREHRTVDLTVK